MTHDDDRTNLIFLASDKSVSRALTILLDNILAKTQENTNAITHLATQVTTITRALTVATYILIAIAMFVLAVSVGLLYHIAP